MVRTVELVKYLSEETGKEYQEEFDYLLAEVIPNVKSRMFTQDFIKINLTGCKTEESVAEALYSCFCVINDGYQTRTEELDNYFDSKIPPFDGIWYFEADADNWISADHYFGISDGIRKVLNDKG